MADTDSQCTDSDFSSISELITVKIAISLPKRFRFDTNLNISGHNCVLVTRRTLPLSMDITLKVHMDQIVILVLNRLLWTKFYNRARKTVKNNIIDVNIDRLISQSVEKAKSAWFFFIDTNTSTVSTKYEGQLKKCNEKSSRSFYLEVSDAIKHSQHLRWPKCR